MEVRVASLDGHKAVLLDFGVFHFFQDVGGFRLAFLQVPGPDAVYPVNLPGKDMNNFLYLSLSIFNGLNPFGEKSLNLFVSRNNINLYYSFMKHSTIDDGLGVGFSSTRQRETTTPSMIILNDGPVYGQQQCTMMVDAFNGL